MRRKALTTYYTGEIIKLPFRHLSREKRIKVGIRIRPEFRLRAKRRKRDRQKKRVVRKPRRYRRSRKYIGSNRYIDINHFSERKHFSSVARFSLLNRAPAFGGTDVKARRYARFVYRSRANSGADFAPLDRLLVRHQRRFFALAAPNTPAVTPDALAKFMPAGTKGRVRRLYRVARRRRELLRGFRAGRERRQDGRKHRAIPSSAPSFTKRAAQYFGRRFVEQAREVSPAAPFVFQRPTALAVKTELVKKREFIASVAEREIRFRFTAQYLESITKYIPALMSQIFSNRIKNTALPPIPYNNARYLARNIY